MANTLIRAWRYLTRIPQRLVPSPKSYAGAGGRAALGTAAVSRGYLFGKRYRPDHEAPRPAGGGREGDAANPLETYFDSHGAGPVIWKWRHYFDIYHRHLAKFVGRDVHVLEVGVYGGGSLKMWQDYFGPGCRMYGVDREPACKAYEDGAVRVFIGDQADRAFWKRFKDEVPPLDVVLDDGGHMPHQQIATLEETLPHLRPGGVYLCEDVHGVFHPFSQYASGLSYNLNEFLQKSGAADYASLTTPFQQAIHSVHLYPYVVVIERAEVAEPEFYSQKQGTERPARDPA
jgi:hypothetical protein